MVKMNFLETENFQSFLPSQFLLGRGGLVSKLDSGVVQLRALLVLDRLSPPRCINDYQRMLGIIRQ